MRVHPMTKLTVLTAGSALLTVAAGGALRAFSLPLLGWVQVGLAVATFVLAGLVTLRTDRDSWAARPAAGLSASLVAVLAAATALVLFMAPLLAPAFEIVLAFSATWMATMYAGGGAGVRPSRLSMFRSQWQVPFYGALALLVVTGLGGYLKVVGAEAACATWPLCNDSITGMSGQVVLAHWLHRGAALLGGLFLLYTVSFIFRRHWQRPVLLVLTTAAIMLFATQVVMGAELAERGLPAAGSYLHFIIATGLVCTLVALSAIGMYSPSLPAISGGAIAMQLTATQRPFREVARDYYQLMKPRVVYLLVITGFAGMWVAQGGMPDLGLTLATLLGLFLSCGGAGAVNMWYDHDIDQVMNRTKNRPVAAGRLTKEQALAFGLLSGALAFVILALFVNLTTAFLTLAGYIFYTVIYTMWLKRSTAQNIVIGGAPGAIPPMIGWAAVHGNVTWASVVMFMIIFMWTPPHFWALALYRNDDYKRANVPMLPVVKGEMHTKWQILAYSILMIPTTAALYWTGVVGEIYLWTGIAATVIYLGANVMLFRERLPNQVWARRSFFWSLLYLTFVFLAMCVDVV